MKKIYKSKIGLELAIPLFLLFGTVLTLSINHESSWIGIITLLPVVVFVVHMFMTTNYTIESNKLTIKCGFLYNKNIDIKTIEKITETNNPLSSPATSLDRLEINYRKFDTVIISPKKKREFVDDLTKLNSDIQVIWKNEK